MRRNVLHAALAVVAGLILAGSSHAAKKPLSPAAYEEGTYVSNEITALRSEIDALRQQLDTTMTTSYDDKKAPEAAVAGHGCSGAAGCCAPCCNSCCNSCCNQQCCDFVNTHCCCKGGWLFDFEATFLKFHREDDFNDANEDDVYGLEFSPRFTVGIVGANCLGFRIRYWEWDHADGNVDVDTYNVDFELFTVTELSCRTTVEWSAGIRYNDYDFLDAQVGAVDAESFSGFGGLFGIRVSHALNDNLGVYGRALWAILMDDGGDIQGDIVGVGSNQFETVRQHQEVGFGVQYATCLNSGSVLAARVGLEWSDWTSYEDGDESVGFGGVVFGIGLNY
jgi:hypothetical protein